jgi:hypothetical protein
MQHKNRVMQRPKTPGQHLAFPLIIYLACSISIVATFTTLVFSKEGSHKSLGHYHTSLFAKKKRGTTITICLLFRVSYFYMRVVCFFQPYTRVSDDNSFGGIVVVAEMAPAVVALVKQLLLL